MTRQYCLLPILLSALLLQGCASPGGEVIRIDVQHVVARQNMPEELTIMLRELGYDWLPIVDPVNRQRVKTVVRNDGYQMLFEYQKTRQARIDVRIRWEDGLTNLHFYEPGNKSLSESSQELLRQLQQRCARQFGATNVTY